MTERRARLLAVDDKPENIRLLEAVLTPAGYEVVGATSAQDALAKARAEPIDLVLTDIVMPGMTGYELCRALRKDEATAYLPIVTITASGAEEKKEALDAGADDFITKPFDKTELLARVRSLLRVKRYHDDVASALERQTAIGEVLRTIASSAFEIEPVLQAVARHAANLCHAENVVIWRTVGNMYRLWVAERPLPEFSQLIGTRDTPIDSDTVAGRAQLEKRPILVANTREYYRDASGPAAELSRVGEVRCLLAVPLIRDDRVVGVISLIRSASQPFTEAEVSLVRAFADQAAIAIANVELYKMVERQRQELTRFLSPQIAALITSEEGAKLLEGHRRQITVVFLDLRGFTSFAETAEPEEVLGLLREYQRAMGELIIRHRGTLEHFAGDGMMVWFNDPLPVERHELQAVRMACAMRERFAEMAQSWSRKGYDLGFGVGIATGYATLGRIGFEGRYDYGAIGNVVILAQRLSAEAKAGQVLVSQRVQAAIESDAETRPIGDLTLKGMSRPVPAFDVTGLKTASLAP